MKNIGRILALTLLAVVFCLTPYAAVKADASIMYAVDDNTDSLYTIDLATGAATLVGPTIEDLSFSGLAYDTSTSTMYASDVSGPVDLSLGTIDLATGAITIIGSHAISSNIMGLAYDSSSDILYGADYDSSGLVVIDRATGAASVVGPYGGGIREIRGLAYSSFTDTLYGIDPTSDFLYTINQTTGAATLVGTLGVNLGFYVGLEVDPDTGIIYAADNSTGNLYTIDPATGAATLVGATGIQVSGLAAVPQIVASVPTMNEWGLIIFMVLAGLTASYFLPRRNEA